MEPSQQDVAAVAQAMGGGSPQPAQPTQPTEQPTQQPQAPEPQQPAQQQPQQQPTQPTEQQTPSQQPAQQPSKGDPFESLFASEEPAKETQPTQQPPAQTAVEPGQPQQQPTQQPNQPTQTQEPAQQPAQQPAQADDDYQTFEEYMNEVTKGVGKAPEMPDAEKISPDDPKAIKDFFDELVNTAVSRAEQGIAKKQAIQSAENKAWNAAFDKYGSLKTNKNLRDMVHNIRMGHFNRGQAISPTQAADKLLDAMSKQYKKGVVDNQVQTRIEQVQPNAGSTGQPVQTTADRDEVLKSVQTGGETALADYLDNQIKSGKM